MVGYRQRNRIAKTPTGNRKGSRVTEMIPPKQISYQNHRLPFLLPALRDKSNRQKGLSLL